MRGSVGGEDLEADAGDGDLRDWDFKKLALGTDDMGANGSYSVVGGHAAMSTGEGWGRVKEWWEKELGATDSATMLPSPAQPWSRCDLMAANEEQRLALSVMFRHCQDLIAAAAREGREPWMVETLPPLRLIKLVAYGHSQRLAPLTIHRPFNPFT